jgi:hypothetical protein
MNVIDEYLENLTKDFLPCKFQGQDVKIMPIDTKILMVGFKSEKRTIPLYMATLTFQEINRAMIVSGTARRVRKGTYEIDAISITTGALTEEK